jgi:hypothetical protein
MGHLCEIVEIMQEWSVSGTCDDFYEYDEENYCLRGRTTETLYIGRQG